jgi:hypothetical protein
MTEQKKDRKEVMKELVRLHLFHNISYRTLEDIAKTKYGVEGCSRNTINSYVSDIRTKLIEDKKIINKTNVNEELRRLELKDIGHPSILTKKQEQEIVDIAGESSEAGNSLKRKDLGKLMKRKAEESGRDYQSTNNLPSMKSIYHFINQHDEMMLVKPKQVSAARKSLSKEDITNWFRITYKQMLKLNENQEPSSYVSYNEINNDNKIIIFNI